MNDVKATKIPLLPAALLSCGAAIIFFTLVAGPTGFWDVTQYRPLFSLRHGIACGAILSVAALLLARRWRTSLSFDPVAWSGIVLLFLFSDWLSRGYNFIQGPLIRGELILTIALCWLYVSPQRTLLLKLLAPLTILIGFSILLSRTSGTFLFSDDLATFLYRLALLKERFPAIPFYNTQWNGGLDQRDFFATGSLNIFFLLSPIIYLFDLIKSFNWLVAITLFFITPLSTFLAARTLNHRGLVPYLAAALSMTSSLLWYRWALAYGTLGFIVSAALFPLVLALITRFINKDSTPSWRTATLLGVSFTLMLFWSASGLALIPAVLAVVVSLKTVLEKRSSLPLAASLLVINIPWLIAFVVVSNVGSFVAAGKNEIPANRSVISETTEEDDVITAPPVKQLQIKGRSASFGVKSSTKLLREATISTNPFILILFIPGLLALSGKTRALYSATVLWLLVLGAMVAPLKPQLELDRMLVILALLGSIPAAIIFQQLLERSTSSLFSKVTSCCLAGILVVSPFSLGSILEGRSLVQYSIASDLVTNMASAIEQNGGEGRVLFSGFVLHELNGGHLAPLALLTTHPLIASSHVHNLWHYQQVFPKEFLEAGDEGIETYLDLYNVTAVIAHERNWREYFLARPEKYEPAWRQDRFILFKRKTATPSYFLQGQGTIEKNHSTSLTISLSTPDAVVKFNYFPFLTSSACTLSEMKQSASVSLIKLSNCPLATPITIKAKNIFQRILN